MESVMEKDILHLLSSRSLNSEREIDFTIHPDDEMFAVLAEALGASRAQMIYFRLGNELSRTIAQIARWRFGNQLDHVRLLEFACGYGRNVRHLVSLFPREHIFVSDIQQAAVDFNVTRFGVRGKISVHDPADLRWAERFDLIVVPSLFSHLPERTFAGWIRALYSLLTPEGLLVFSVHGTHVLGDETEVPDNGILFELKSENSVLPKDEYGMSYVTEAFVREQIRKATGRDSYALTKRGFWQHQDFYIISKSEDIDLASFKYDRGLASYIDRISGGSNGSIRLSGWARETRDPSAEVRVRVRLDDRHVAESVANQPRPDLAGVFGSDFSNSGFSLEFKTSARRHHLENTLIVELSSAVSTECIHALRLGDSFTEKRKLSRLTLLARHVLSINLELVKEIASISVALWARLKKPPVGPSSARVARQTIASAPSSFISSGAARLDRR
jgi:SAM-dependent methyltransferase